MRYLHVSGWRVWRWMLSRRYLGSRVGIFRNLPHVKPGRWGFYLLGFEVGSRNPQDPGGRLAHRARALEVVTFA